jgi:hypothetical protein
MPAADPVLESLDRFTGAVNARHLDAVLPLVPDDVASKSTATACATTAGTRSVGSGDICAPTRRKARFTVEGQFSTARHAPSCAAATQRHPCPEQ